MQHIGVDTGGTFTDLILLGNECEIIRILKIPSTHNPSLAVCRGVSELAPKSFEISHGTTVGTNAFLERKGAPTAFITTKGFKDLLRLRRGTRPQLYALSPHREPDFIPASRCYEVDERLDHEGNVLQPLSLSQLTSLRSKLKGQVETVAVCLLFSYRNPEHELIVQEAFANSGLYVSLSHTLSPEPGEYERAVTTSLNAYLHPLMDAYLKALDDHFRTLGAKKFWIVHSAGAVMSLDEIKTRPISTVLSGPAAGVQGAFAVARQSGFSHIITLDMGGTSTDVSLCPGELLFTSEGYLGELPLRQSMLEVHTVGAGGGSIVRADKAGALQVGPRSAGADPGPAAYGKGTLPTITDAHVVLGHLPTALAGGTISLDRARSYQAFSDLAQHIGCSVEETARGALEVVLTNMEKALRVISVERGYDPRRFTLVAYGGAGPLHATELADRLEIPSVLIPKHPGLLCALGAVLSPHQREYTTTILTKLANTSPSNLAMVFHELTAKAVKNIPYPDQDKHLLGLRYEGQGYELLIPYNCNDRCDGTAAASSLSQVEQLFHQAHAKRFGYHRPEHPIELVTARLRRSKIRARLSPVTLPSDSNPPTPYRSTTALLGTPPQEITLPFYDRSKLSPGHQIKGPAVITEYDATTLITPGWTCSMDATGNLLLEKKL